MLIEMFFLLGWLAAGMLCLHATGLRGWGLAPLGFIVGASGYIAVATLVLMTAVPRLPIVSLTLLLGVASVWWLRRTAKTDRDTLLAPAAIALPLTAAAVLTARGARLVNYHFDSLEHAAHTAMMATGRLTYIDIAHVQFRGIGFPLLHTPAPLAGELYLASVGPLLALSLLGALLWFTRAAVPVDGDSRRPLVVGLLGALLLLSNNRVVFHAFYLHGHTITAATLLAFAGSGWLLALGNRPWLHRSLSLIQLAVLPALVLARPESIAIAALVIAPTLLSSRIARRHRIAVAGIYGAAVLAPQLFFIAEGYRVAGEPHSNTLTLLPIGLVGATVALLLARLQVPPARERAWITLAYAVILVATAGMFVVSPEVMTASVRALWGNVAQGGGGWGGSILVLAVLLGTVLILTALPERRHLAFPVLTFIPAALLLALARDGAYRVDPADSLNRMLLHVVPLAVLLLTSTIVAGSARRRLGAATAPASGEPAPRTV